VKQVLIYENRKTTPLVWDVSTPELKDKAFLSLFKVLDKDWEVYGDLDPSCATPGCNHSCNFHIPIEPEHPNLQQQVLYTKAKNEDVKAAAKLLMIRQGEEYENWYITEVEDAT